MNRPGARWTGWAVTGAVHVAMVLALASAFAPSRPPLPMPSSISARLIPSSTSSTSAGSMASAMTPLEIILPRSALLVPPSPEIPPPPVQIVVTPPVVPPPAATSPLRFDAPTAAGLDTSAASRTQVAMGVAATTTTTTSSVATPAPVVPPSQTPAPTSSSNDAPVAFPADHRLCSERQTARLYPAMLRERGIQGQVLLRVKVDADGRAAEVVVAGGSGWRLLDEAARRVAESCPYLPARRGDQKLVSWVEYPVRFALQPSTLQ